MVEKTSLIVEMLMSILMHSVHTSRIFRVHAWVLAHTDTRTQTHSRHKMNLCEAETEEKKFKQNVLLNLRFSPIQTLLALDGGEWNAWERWHKTTVQADSSSYSRWLFGTTIKTFPSNYTMKTEN